jgi:hypothetical protein
MRLPSLPRTRFDVPMRLPCARCGGHRRLAPGHAICGDCRREVSPSELDRALSARGWTLLDLAERAGVGRTAVSRLVAGEVVSARTLAAVSAATGIPIERLSNLSEVSRGS